MCGIAGFCNFQEDFLQDAEMWKQVLVRMRTTIAHRGNDQTGEYLQHNVGLSHTRLSIRDLSGGAQPMLRKRGDWDYGIVYNGEIYNAEELKQDLIRRGCRFETTCDTEVILYGYMEYGMEVAKQLNGIFAFAIWDAKRNTLFLCRDRLGVKPLFYAIKGDILVYNYIFLICSAIPLIIGTQTVFPHCLYTLVIGISGKLYSFGKPCRAKHS